MNLKNHIHNFCFIALLCLTSNNALAACSANENGIPGQAGEIEYFSSSNMLRYCDDTNWIDMLNPEINAPSTGLVGHWKLDETSGTNIIDSSSTGNNGTWSDNENEDVSEETALGILNNSLELDSDDNIVIPANTIYNVGTTGSFSTSIWFSTTSTSPRVYAETNGTQNHRIDLTLGRIRVRLQDNLGNLYDNTTGTSGDFNTGQFIHMVNTFDRSNNLAKLYINDAEVDSNSITALTGSIGFDSLFGINNTFGTIKKDDFRFYNRALSPSEITDLYNSGSNRGLVGYWKLDETSGTTAFDSSGNGHDATMMGSLNGSTNSVTGMVGNAINFDEGDSDRINIPDSGMPTGTSPAFSMGAWVKVQENSPQTAARWSMGYGDTTDGTNDAQIILDRDANYISYQVGTTGQGVSVANYLNKWMHIFLTFDGTNARLYKSGVRLRTDTVTTFNPVSSNGTIGGRLGGGADFNGDFDEVRMYNRALSESEVEILSICTGAGTYAYNFTEDAMQFCDGVNSVNNMHIPASGAGGCTSPAASEGAMDYDVSTNTYRACDGSGWITIEE